MALIEICIWYLLRLLQAGISFVFYGQAAEPWSQRHQCDQIGDGHGTVDHLGEEPKCFIPDQRRKHHRGGLTKGENAPDISFEEELAAPDAVQSPAEDRGEGEAAKRPGQEIMDPAAADGGKGRACQSPSGVHAVGDGNTGDQDHQSGQCANDDGVQEHLHDPQQSLLGRMPDLGAGVCHGCGAHSGLIGEYASGAAHPKSLQGSAHNSAGNGPGGGGPDDDLPQCLRDCSHMGEKHP